MKVTAILPDELINEIRKLAQGDNLTDCLIIALKDWSAKKRLEKLTLEIKQRPLEFQAGFSGAKIRELNRKS